MQNETNWLVISWSLWYTDDEGSFCAGPNRKWKCFDMKTEANTEAFFRCPIIRRFCFVFQSKPWHTKPINGHWILKRYISIYGHCIDNAVSVWTAIVYGSVWAMQTLSWGALFICFTWNILYLKYPHIWEFPTFLGIFFNFENWLSPLVPKISRFWPLWF